MLSQRRGYLKLKIIEIIFLVIYFSLPGDKANSNQ